MKKCPYCNKTFPDSVMRCPKDAVFLMSAMVPDLEEQKSQNEDDIGQDEWENRKGSTFSQDDDGRVSRQRTKLQAADFESRRGSRTEGTNDRTSVLKPGRSVVGQERRADSNNKANRINIGGVRIARRSSYLRRAVPVLRIAVPAVLILVSIILVVGFWGSIRPVLSCLMIGAIIGGSVALFLTLRFGRHFNIDAVFSGAVVGGLLACFIRYNILDVGSGLTELVYAIGPIVIILIALWRIIRSMFR